MQCIKNSQCASGHCEASSNTCQDKVQIYDPCKGDSYCDGMICDPYLHRCVVMPYKYKSTCDNSFECPAGEFCNNGKCRMQKGQNSSCSKYDECGDGLGCFQGKCTQLCKSGVFDCPSGSNCVGSYCVKGKTLNNVYSESPGTVAEGDLSTGAILGIALGAAIGLALIILVIVMIVRKCRQRPSSYPPPPAAPPPPPMIYTPSVPMAYSPSYPPADAPPPSYDSHVPQAPPSEKH